MNLDGSGRWIGFPTRESGSQRMWESDSLGVGESGYSVNSVEYGVWESVYSVYSAEYGFV